MPEIGFYHLTRTDVTEALPSLLARTLIAGEHALVLCGVESRVAALDKFLWTSSASAWLPHGTSASPHPEWQPIFLCHAESNPASATFAFLTDGATLEHPESYIRIFDLFNGNNDAEIAAARVRFKQAKASGYVVTYWKQGEAGWQKQ